MDCPVCGGRTYVDSCTRDCESVYRRRKCKECNHVFYTDESEVESANRTFHRLSAEKKQISNRLKKLV